MRWEKPCTFLDFLVGVLALAVLLFVMTWLGYDNAPIPRFWDDSIPFFEALGNFPRILLAAFLVGMIGVGLSGIRRGG